jgi:single-strand DNA-binding protein
MIIVGSLTKDAEVRHLNDDRKVVGFSIAINDYYKPKGQEQGITTTTFINCSYWISSAMAEHLKKGALVELFGRIGINVYKDMEGEARGSLTFHVNFIKIHQFSKEGKGESDSSKPPRKKKKEKEEVAEDLPF